jgi:hypothetical protein
VRRAPWLPYWTTVQGLVYPDHLYEPAEMRFPTIPPDEQVGLDRLAGLTDEQVAALRAALADAPVALSREGFLKGIRPVEDLAPEDQEKIVWALTYLSGYLATGNYDLREFVSDVSTALVEQEVISTSTSERVETVLLQLLEIDSLRLRAKAVDLQVDHALGFQNARVFTDVRPVFANDAPTEVAGILVFHTLKITYFEDEDTREFFISLDDRDLAVLRGALDRAETKANTLRQLFADRLQMKDFGAEAD